MSQRVFLQGQELYTTAGRELLDLCLTITRDGKLDRAEIIRLAQWLKAHESETGIAAIPYLSSIMNRITADRLIDRQELTELHLAVERVIPRVLRGRAKAARKKREAMAKGLHES